MTQDKILEKSITIAYDKVKKLIAFCQDYEIWPKEYIPAQNDYEKLSNELYRWLKRNHFNSLKYRFKFDTLLWQDDILVLDVIERLYNKYGSENAYRNTKTYIINIIQEFSEYCHKFQTWPTQVHNPKDEKELLSRKYSKWLSNVDYNYEKQTFKYKDFIMPDNRLAISIMNELYEKYYRYNKFTPEHVLLTVYDIIKYCNQYNEFPKQIRDPKTSQEKLSCRLAYWLSKSNYFLPGKFKYFDIMFNETKSIKEVLDFYYYHFSKNHLAQKQAYYNMLKEQYSKSYIDEIFYSILKIKQYVYTNFEKYDYHLTKTLNLLKKHKIDLDIKTLLLTFTKSFEEQLLYFKGEYNYALQNKKSDLAYLYGLLTTYIEINAESLDASMRH